MRWIKNLFASPAPTTGEAVTIPPAFEIEVPRYPPFMKGLPVVEPEKLLASQAEILAQYKRSVIVDAAAFETHYMGGLRRFANFAHLLPASQSHHHRGAGGLLRHSMEVALGALQGADKMLLNVGKSPAQRRSIEPRWQLTAFLAGLCHDVGKPATDITITSSDRNLTWKPLSEDLYTWAKKARISSYFLDWRPGRGKQHIALSNLISERIIGTESLQWIEEGGTDLVVWLMEALNGSPGANNPLYDLIIRADQASVERDLKSMGVAMAGYELGVPVERHLTDIMRRLIKEGLWQINEPGARVWNVNGGIYLVWPAAGEEIARKVREDGVPGFPRTHDGILDMLRERGLAFIREGDGERFWKISPEVLEAKIPNISLACVRLRDDSLISSVPIPSVAGKLRNAEEQDQYDDQPTGAVSASTFTATTAAAYGAAEAALATKQHALGSPETSPQPSSTPASSASSTPAIKAAPPKFTIDQATGEILAVESGDSNSKKKPELRTLPTSENPATRQGISKPAGLKIRQPAPETLAAGSVASATSAADPPASSHEMVDPIKKKKGRKKRDYTKEPELKFTGSVGELFLALADDLKNGVKKWGSDVRVDHEHMVLLRWPASFANYGLSGKNILDECKKNEWIWVDQDTPFVRLVDAEFDGEPSKALRLMPDPGDALLFHAKYNPEAHTVTAASKSSQQPQDDNHAPVMGLPEPVAKAPDLQKPLAMRAKSSSPEPEAVASKHSAHQPEAPIRRNHPQGKQSQPQKSKATPNTPKAVQDMAVNPGEAPAPKSQETRSASSSVATPSMAAHSEATAPHTESSSPPNDTPRAGSAHTAPQQVKEDGADPRALELIKALDACPIIKKEHGWIFVDRLDVRRIAIETGIAKDRKDLNLLIEQNAKYLQVVSSNLRYQSPT